MKTWRPLKGFLREQGGLAAVEFALIAPLLIMFYFGLVEICSAYMAQKRMGHATAMVADLIAQEDMIDTAALEDIASIAVVLMEPFPAAPLSISISSVTQTNDVARVGWSWADGGALEPRDDDEIVTLPEDVIENGQSVIMTEAIYQYESPIGDLLPGITTFRAVYYLRPRISDVTACTNC